MESSWKAFGFVWLMLKFSYIIKMKYFLLMSEFSTKCFQSFKFCQVHLGFDKVTFPHDLVCISQLFGLVRFVPCLDLTHMKKKYEMSYTYFVGDSHFTQIEMIISFCVPKR